MAMNLLTKAIKLVRLSKTTEPLTNQELACMLYAVSPSSSKTWVRPMIFIINSINDDDGEKSARVASLLSERFSREETSTKDELVAMAIYAHTYGNGYLALVSLLSMIDKDSLIKFLEVV